MSRFKVTFELSKEAAITAALNAGARSDEDAELSAMGIQRMSTVKLLIKPGNQYQQLMAQQSHGYVVVGIEAA